MAYYSTTSYPAPGYQSNQTRAVAAPTQLKGYATVRPVGFTQKTSSRPVDVEKLSPVQALTMLREGNHRFVSGQTITPNRSPGRVKEVAGGQKPFAAFLGCADSRVPVEILFDQGFGDVFVTRVAGNVASTEIIGSLEFGCAVLGAKVLYVLGHSACGAVSATMKGAAVPGVISSLYYHIQPATEGAKSEEQAIVNNVRRQVDLLRASPVISGLVKEGKLILVGGVYDLETGSVREVC